MGHVLDNNECTSEDALVSGLGPFDQFAAQYNVQPSRHGASENLVRIFLNRDLLPVRKFATVEGQLPLRSVSTQWMRAQVGFGILKLLLNFRYVAPAFLAEKGPKIVMVGLRSRE